MGTVDYLLHLTRKREHGTMDGIEHAPAFEQLWRRTVGSAPDARFLLFPENGGRVREWTYAGFDEIVGRVATVLREHGVGPDRPVHLALGNCPAFVAVWLACSRLGSWMVPADPRAPAGELAGQLPRVSPAVGLCATARAPTYRDAVATAGQPDIAVIELTETGDDLESGKQLVPAATGVSPASVPESGPDTRRLAVMFTSGTTGTPKGVVVTQANYGFAAEVMANAAGIGPRSRLLVSLPLFHANAQYYSFAPAIARGATVALMPSFSATRWLAQAAEHQVTHASLFAAPIRMILSRGDRSVRLPRIEHLWFAQDLSHDQYEEFAGLVSCRPRQLYGMTETIPAVLSHTGPQPRPDSIGTVTPGCRVRIVDPVTGADAAPGVVGDVLVGGRPGENLFLEYLDDPETTAASRFEDEDTTWFRTGDQVEVGHDGLVRFRGRAKDVLKVAGENVSIAEVETALAEHPGVLEVAVVGRSDSVHDEVPVAFVVARDPALTVPALESWAAKQLAPSKRPRDWVMRDELPRTSVGKIKRFLLRHPGQEETPT